MNHLRWIILVAACFGCVGCERDRDTPGEDLRAEAPGVTPRRDMPQPRTDITDQRRADMPQQRADMPRDQQMEQQVREQQAQQRADRPGGDQMASAAVQAIARARCEREQRCGNIGAGENFATNEACLAEVRRDWADELSAYECPAGVEQTELTSCVQEIRAEDCASPFDTLARVVECRSADICQAG